MSYPSSKRVSKPVYQGLEEKEANRKLAEARKKAFPRKTLKMECVYSLGGTEYAETGWYVSVEEFEEVS